MSFLALDSIAMTKSGIYLAINGEPSQSPPPPHRSAHIARTTSLVEVQALKKHHAAACLSKEYEHLRKSEKELKGMKKSLREYYEALNQQVSD